MWIIFSNIMFLQLFILFRTRVLEFWVMEATNLYDFLHLLNLTKIRPNMDFGGNLAFAHIYATIHFPFSFFFKQSEERPTSKY
jgi:hypothetical protein